MIATHYVERRRNMKRFLAILICVSMLFSSIGPMHVQAQDTAFEGSGTEESPYLIRTAEDLVLLSQIADTDSSYASAHYLMTADLDLDGTVLKPIGLVNHFSGVLDGGGHTLTNVTIDKTDTDHTGLISFLERGTLKNLGIESGTVTGGNRTGALVGRTMYAKISNCYSKATVKGGNDTGGLVGMYNNSDMENCYVWGSVTGSVSTGGLAGGANRSIDSGYPASIKNCYSIASVSGAQHVGVLVGYDESASGFDITMENLYYDGTKTGVGNNEGRSGTVKLSGIQLTDGTLLNSLNANRKEGYREWLSGITSYPEFDVPLSENGLAGNGTAENPYRIRTAEDLVLMQTIIEENADYADDSYLLTADLDMAGITMAPIGLTHHFSGIFDGRGHKLLNLNIENGGSEPTGLFSYVEHGTVINLGIEGGTISGKDKTGSLIGRTMYAAIRNCFTTATVHGGADVGGLVGMFNNSVLENCYARANVTGTVTVGGLIAGTNRSIDPSAETIVKNCYSTSQVSGDSYVGALIGYDESTAGAAYQVTMENLYYDSTATGIGNNNGRAGTIAVASGEFTNGTLVGRLNANAGEGYSEWLETTSGYPGFEGKVVVITSLEGEGTEASPYLIKTTDDLLEMVRVIDLSNDFAKAHYKLTASLDLDGTGFQGIGASNSFKGVFDGTGHVVTHIDIHVTGKEMTGFFHSAEGAVIKNFGIESGMVRGQKKVGALAGRTMQTTILNCYNHAVVRGLEDVGGLVGMLNNSDLLNSYNSGEVIASKSIGGLAGSICRSLNPEAEANIKNCYQIGHVHWGTYSGTIAGYVEDGSNMANYTGVYYNRDEVPEIAAGNFKEISASGMKEEELKSQSFVDTMNSGKEDGYGDWGLGSDGTVRLSMFGEAAEIDCFLASITDQPEIANGGLVLPASGSGRYRAVLAGSNNQQVVALDGSVYEPLTAQRVYLIYDIIDTARGDKVAARLDRNVILDVEGKYADAGGNEMPNVVPGLREWHGAEGSFTVTSESRIIALSAEETSSALKVKEYLDGITGFDLAVSADTAENGDIVLKYVPDLKAELGEEGYYVTIGDQLVIEAPTETGMLYGGISISQILYQEKTHTLVPKGIIRDYPEYPMRGGMMDVARKYFELDYIEEMGRYMAWFKMNTFHLHINEDSGLGGEYSSSFVVESKKYPALNTYNEGYIWSQDDYRQMQKNLKDYGVNVITEIDSPGHATIFNLIDSSIVNGSNFDLANHYDESLALIESVFDEYLDGEDPVFQNAVVHIGTDESANTSENMRRYINDLAQYCLSKDNIDDVVFWGNLSVYAGETEIASDHVISQVWDGADQRVEEALADGFDLINSTSNSMYLIPGNANGLHNGYVDMSVFYDTWKGSTDFTTHRIGNPTWIAGRNYYVDYDLLLGNPQILGTVFCNWNDRSWGNDYDVLDLVLSYIGVISEKCWYGDADRFDSGAEFSQAFQRVSDHAPNANPRRKIDTDSDIIAKYDFEQMTENTAADTTGSYHAALEGVAQVQPGEDYLYGKAAALTPDSRISLPFSGVGYPYTVNFDLYLDGTQEDGAVLFRDGSSAFYLDYEGRGVGYQIGKYGYTYDVTLPTDQWINVTLTSTYVHGSTATTILKIDGMTYSPSLIVNPPSVGSHSATSFLGTSEMFTGINGFLDNLTIGNKYNQALSSGADFELEGEGTEQAPYLIKTKKDLLMFANQLNTGTDLDAHFKLLADLDMSGIKYAVPAEFGGTFDGNGHVISNLSISVPGGENVGFVGLLNGGTIKNLGISNASVNGKSRVGVLAGRTMYASIINCFAKGTVEGEWDCALIAGMFNNSVLKNSYAIGKVSATRETAGGLTGGTNRSIDPSTPAILDNCYVSAEVTAPSYAGEVAGYDESVAGEAYKITMTNLYSDGKMAAVGNNANREGITVLTEAEFTDGTLKDRLNGNLAEGYLGWVTGEDQYPTFKDISTAGKMRDALEKLSRAWAEEDLSGYTAESAETLKAALEAAKAVLDKAKPSMEEISKATAALVRAIGTLEYGVQKVHLETVISVAEKLLVLENNYDVSDAKELKAAVAAGKDVYDNAQATQAEADAATNAILDVLAKLSKKADVTSLESLMEAAKELAESGKYTDDSTASLQESIARAEAVLADPDRDENALADAYSGIINAIIALQRRGNKAALGAIILKAEEILANAGQYVAESLNGLAEALDAGRKVYDDADAIQADINEAVKTLTLEAADARLLGDVNGDGTVTTSDTAVVLQAAAEYMALSEEQAAAADVNGDGAADTTDAVLILQYAAEKITAF